MNILMLNYEYPPLGGGGGVFNKQLAEELAKHNDVTIITSNFKSQKSKEILNGVKIHRVPVFMRKDQAAASILSMLSFFPTSICAGFRLIKKKPFDLIHTMFAIPSGPSALFLSKYFKIPHLLSILGGDIYDPSKKLSPHKTPFLHFVVKNVLEKSDKVVALSSDIKQRTIKHYGFQQKIDVIHLGIPEQEVIIKNRKGFGFKYDDILLITVGRLVPRKALQDSIRTIADLKEKNVKLIIVGDGPERNNLQKLSEDLNIGDRIFFWGYVSEDIKFQLLNIADIYISTSHHEGFGIVFLEAMAQGLPIVSYDKGGQADFLVNRKTGYLVKYGEKELLVNRVKKLIHRISDRKKIRDFNKEYIKNFYIETCAKRYQAAYDELVKIRL